MMSPNRWTRVQPVRRHSPDPGEVATAGKLLLQEQLGQLNYYNGPATGYMNHGTRTGDHVPPARRPPAADRPAEQRHRNPLDSMLAGGNNQMGGNINNNQMNANNDQPHGAADAS